jgi:hypothetical protein
VTTGHGRGSTAGLPRFVECGAILSNVSVSAIQHLIDDLAARLQRSVVVDDANVKLLYASRHFGDVDEARRRGILQRDPGAQIIGYVLSQGVSTWTTAGIIPGNETLGLKTRVCVPVRWRGTLLGLLMVVDSEGTLTTAEMSLITEASQDLAALMIGEHAPEIDEADLALSTALDDLVAPESELHRAAVRTLTGRLGDHADRHVRVLQVDAFEGRAPTSPGHMSAGFRHALAAEGARPFAWTILPSIHERSALILITSRSEINDDAVVGFAKDLVARIHAVATDRFSCVAGVGGRGVGFDQARSSFRQARLAASAGRTLLHRPVVAWSELGELAVLLQLPLEQLDEDCLPDEVHRLLSFDKDGRSLETVLAFLEHAGSAPDTAEALHLHRTTLYYRLERVREATGLDLDDGRTRLALHLGLRLRELLRTRQVHPSAEVDVPDRERST